jgi:PAS domain S-box-containing protein
MFVQTRDAFISITTATIQEESAASTPGFYRKEHARGPAARDWPSAWQIFSAGDRDPKTQLVEYELEINEEPRWFEARIVSSGENILSVIRDITERKRAENELAASHRKVNEILESIGDAFYSVDSDLRFTYVNRKTEELWALRRQDLIGRSFLDVFPQAIGTDSYRVIMRARDEGRPINFEGLSPVINRWVDVSVYPTPAGLSIYFRDATERKEAENALRESESRLQRAQQAARVATWEWNLATGESLWSEMLWHLLGLEPGDGEATVERFLQFIHPEDREETWRVANEAIEHGELYDHEFRILRTDGEVLWLASKGRVIRSADGNPDRMIGVNIDVTDRHRALNEIRESHERFAKAFRSNPQPMSLTTLATGKYLDVNDSFLQVSGYRRDEIIGKTSLELNIWGSPEARQAFIDELKDRGSW